MKVIEGIAQMKAWSREARARGERITLVPTMGALHAAHTELFKRARDGGGKVVGSIFVNPAQFGPTEDLASYPGSMDKDVRTARDAGVDVLFTPNVEEVYPPGFQTRVDVQRLGSKLCAVTRPAHFSGVATVVLKLFNIVMPHNAVFGLKDYQQFIVIRRMTRDLDLDIEIQGVETVRDSDGLALSSRNGYLTPAERKAASLIPFSLNEARRAFSGGVRSSVDIIGRVRETLSADPLAAIEYVKVCDTETLDGVDTIEQKALVAVAVRIGRARLIDNCILS